MKPDLCIVAAAVVESAGWVGFSVDGGEPGHRYCF